MSFIDFFYIINLFCRRRVVIILRTSKYPKRNLSYSVSNGTLWGLFMRGWKGFCVHLRTKFQLDKSKFAWVRQFLVNFQKIQNLKKFKRFSRLWPNSISKFLDQYNISVCSLSTIARILRKLELPRPFFKKFNVP